MTNSLPPDEPADPDAIDRQIAGALAGLPAPDVPADLPVRVTARLARRRLLARLGGVAAVAALLLMAWGLSPPEPHRPVHPAPEKPGQEALLAQWDELLDEAGALPPVVVDLNILEAQHAWVSALEDVQRHNAAGGNRP
jgi:hypothetical protein